MEKARPIRERELLIDDTIRGELRQVINPRIDSALLSHGYTEEHSAPRRIYLSGTKVIPSPAYRLLSQTPFDGLNVASTYDVFGNEQILTKGTVTLSRIGGFSTSQLVMLGDRFYTTHQKPGSNQGMISMEISKEEAQDIMQDIRAHTELGYSNSDSSVSVPEVIQELESLHTSLSIDQRAHYQLLTSKEHGDIQMNIGKSFEVRDIENNRSVSRRQFNMKRLFELIAKQPLAKHPLDDGTVTVGAHYRSGQNETELKITADIDSDGYTEGQKKTMYDEMVHTYQEKNPFKLGGSVLINLAKIQDPDSDVIRVG